VTVLLDVQAQLTNLRDKAEIDGLVLLVQALYDAYTQDRDLHLMPGWRTVGDETDYVDDQVFSWEALYKQQRFESALSITVRGHR
jgi:hypothetical protein